MIIKVSFFKMLAIKLSKQNTKQNISKTPVNLSIFFSK